MLDPVTIYDSQCPDASGVMSLFAIVVPDPFCEINPICEEVDVITTREQCEENLTVTYAVIIASLIVVLIGGGIFCFVKRRTICRNRRGPSQSMKRQILQDQLIGDIGDNLVQQVRRCCGMHMCMCACVQRRDHACEVVDLCHNAYWRPVNDHIHDASA